MERFKNIDQVFDFAIVAEQQAVDFYHQLMGRVQNKEMQKVFGQFMREEMAHKKRLMLIKQQGSYRLRKGGEVTDLKISDYMVDVEPGSNMTYEEALVLAMQREKKSFMLYLQLSEQADDEEMRSVFLELAQEESRHKLRFELEYDEQVLREN